MKPFAVIVMGMHRSGTSMMTGALRILGVHLGQPQELMGAGADNTSGFHEHAGLSGVNVRILERLGGSWDKIPEFPPNWEKVQMNDLRAEAAGVVTRSLSYAPVWAFKDPRNSLTYPFWRIVAGRPTKALIMLRNPLDVARSLQARNGFPIKKSVDLWRGYTERAMSSTQGAERLMVVYEKFMKNIEAGTATVAAFVGCSDWKLKLEEVKKFVQDKLWHQRSTHREIEANPDVQQALGNNS